MVYHWNRYRTAGWVHRPIGAAPCDECHRLDHPDDLVTFLNYEPLAQRSQFRIELMGIRIYFYELFSHQS